MPNVYQHLRITILKSHLLRVWTQPSIIMTFDSKVQMIIFSWLFNTVCWPFCASPQIPVSALVSFVEALEVGYGKHRNPYHNLIHAADVTQTVHYLLLKTGMVVSPELHHQKPTSQKIMFMNSASSLGICACLCVLE